MRKYRASLDPLDPPRPFDDLVTRPARTAEAARRLTVDDVAPLLRTLEHEHAAMVVTGPQAAIDAAFAAFGRHATNVD